MTGRLQGKVCVVTGGGAGIGEAACKRFAAEGAHAVAVDRYAETARETVADIEADGGPEALAVECDVGDEGDIEAMAETVEGRFGRVDALVNNAAIRVEPKPATETADADWDAILGVNLKGYAYCAKHLVPLMGEGAIVNVASVGAELARPGWLQYDATKGGIVSMTQDMACDFAPEIRVNALSPGSVVTDYHVGDRTGEEAERYIEHQTSHREDGPGILKRKCQPDEIAPVLAFLVSEEASFVTGANVHADGGLSVTGW